MSIVIIKNTDVVDHQWGGVVIAASNQYVMQEVDRIRFLSDEHFLQSLTDLTAVINDGTQDLNPEQGLLLVEKKLKLVHEALAFSPAIGISAPEIIVLTTTSAAHGHRFEIGDEMFALTHFENIVLNDVQLQLHMAIDNATADRWIEFEFDLLSTTGILDKAIDGVDATITTGPVQVPTTPFLIFDAKASIPTTLFANGEDNIFIRLRRIAPSGKVAPTNHPVVVRIDKIHKQKLDV